MSFKSELVLDPLSVGFTIGISQNVICFLIQMFSNVKHIGLSGMFLFIKDKRNIETQIVNSIVSNCPQLQSIDFEDFHDFDEVFIKNSNYFRRLKKISSKFIGEKALNSIIDSQNLESIDIRRNLRISRLEFKRFGPKICELNLIRSKVFDYNVIKSLSEGNGRKIEFLKIDIKDANVLSLICDNLLKLKEFKLCLYSENCDFKRFSNLKDLKNIEIIVKICLRLKCQEFCDLIRSFKKLRISNLRVDLWPNDCIAITDESLQKIRVNCPLIEKLVIRYSDSLTDTGMYAISQMRHIRHLDLKNCLNISDQIGIVITSCPLLRKLILHNCCYITHSTVIAFSEKAKELPKENFYLDVIDTNVSEETLAFVGERPKNLKLLYEIKDCVYDCGHESYDNLSFDSKILGIVF